MRRNNFIITAKSQMPEVSGAEAVSFLEFADWFAGRHIEMLLSAMHKRDGLQKGLIILIGRK